MEANQAEANQAGLSISGPASSVSLKPNTPTEFAGKRDFLSVYSWLYKIEQYLLLLNMCNPNISNAVPANWEAFKTALKTEFIPEDHIRRARDKLKKLKQHTYVAACMAVRVDGAMWRMYDGPPHTAAASEVTPMEMGNVEANRRTGSAARKQRPKDMENNACLDCPTPGYRL
eukprot:IDg9546t1